MSKQTEIRVNECGDEMHESWLLIRANHTRSTPGQHLFDSELAHSRYVTVTISRCARRRDLNHDWLRSEDKLMEFALSQAQWGAFVSSFGDGNGVPATLTYLVGEGRVPGAVHEPRLAVSHREVREAAAEALAEIRAAAERVEELFEAKAGRRDLGAALRDLFYKVENGPANMQFAAESLTKHTENVMTKARADIEAIVLDAIRRGAPELAEPAAAQLSAAFDVAAEEVGDDA